MERNDDNIGNLGASSNTGGLGGASSGSAAFGSTEGMSGTDGVTDRARDLAGTAKERAADAGSALRDRAGSAKNSLADMLEAGANRLNSQGGSTQLAGATGTGSVAADGTNRLAAVAGGLQGSADWLREADLDGMRSGIESQVRTNPGRSLLLAVGLGYLVGKAFRR